MKRFVLIAFWIGVSGCVGDQPMQGTHALAMREGDDPPDPCDHDSDGHLSLDCGGDDCNDNNPDVYGANGCLAGGGCVTPNCNHSVSDSCGDNDHDGFI